MLLSLPNPANAGVLLATSFNPIRYHAMELFPSLLRIWDLEVQTVIYKLHVPAKMRFADAAYDPDNPEDFYICLSDKSFWKLDGSSFEFETFESVAQEPVPNTDIWASAADDWASADGTTADDWTW